MAVTVFSSSFGCKIFPSPAGGKGNYCNFTASTLLHQPPGRGVKKNPPPLFPPFSSPFTPQLHFVSLPTPLLSSPILTLFLLSFFSYPVPYFSLHHFVCTSHSTFFSILLHFPCTLPPLLFLLFSLNSTLFSLHIPLHFSLPFSFSSPSLSSPSIFYISKHHFVSPAHSTSILSSTSLPLFFLAFFLSISSSLSP